MINSLARAAASMNGTLHGKDRKFTGVSTDTRSLRDAICRWDRFSCTGATTFTVCMAWSCDLYSTSFTENA